MSLAARAREAAREHPFLVAGLRAGVVNHRAAAEFLDLDGDPDAVATALRRFADTLPEYATDARDARVTMHRGLGVVDAAATEAEDATLLVGDAAVVPDAGDDTAVVATGAADASALWVVLGRLATADIDVIAAGVTVAASITDASGVTDAALVVVVGRRAGATTLRLVEEALDAVPR